MTGSKPLPKRSLHILRSTASSFKWQYPLLSLRSSSSFLRLLPRLLVTSISPFIFPSITCFRRQFLRKMWPIQLAFRFLIACEIFLCSLTWSNTSSFLTWSVQLISILLQHHISNLSRCFFSAARSVQVSAPYKAMLQMWHFAIIRYRVKKKIVEQGIRIRWVLHQPHEAEPYRKYCRLSFLKIPSFLSNPLCPYSVRNSPLPGRINPVLIFERVTIRIPLLQLSVICVYVLQVASFLQRFLQEIIIDFL